MTAHTSSHWCHGIISAHHSPQIPQTGSPYPISDPRKISRHKPQKDKEIRYDKDGDKAPNDTTPLVCMNIESRLAEWRRLRRRHDARGQCVTAGSLNLQFSTSRDAKSQENKVRKRESACCARTTKRRAGTKYHMTLSENKHAARPSTQFGGAVYMLCHNSLIPGHSNRRPELPGCVRWHSKLVLGYSNGLRRRRAYSCRDRSAT